VFNDYVRQARNLQYLQILTGDGLRFLFEYHSMTDDAQFYVKPISY